MTESEALELGEAYARLRAAVLKLECAEGHYATTDLKHASMAGAAVYHANVEVVAHARALVAIAMARVSA